MTTFDQPRITRPPFIGLDERIAREPDRLFDQRVADLADLTVADADAEVVSDGHWATTKERVVVQVGVHFGARVTANVILWWRLRSVATAVL